MENNIQQHSQFKLNYKRTLIIGFAFFGICLLWQVYDTWCPTFLTELFKDAIYGDAPVNEKQVQYLVGIMMALDNLAALVLLPLFGHLSDKTHTRLGKRMPYIIGGTLVSAIAFPFIPVFFHYNNMVGTIILMAIVVCTMMMYRNPAVALMPDMTPKPLRSKANGIINIMGYIGGAFATIVGMIFVLSDYLGTTSKHPWLFNNIWAVEGPFLVASTLMVISAVVLCLSINEHKVIEEVKDDLERGEQFAEIEDKVSSSDKLSARNRRMLIFILIAEFFWFMADNGIGTFMGNYTVYHLKAATSSNAVNTLIGGLGSVLGFALGGIIASKIGRKYTVVSGLSLSLFSYIVWLILTFTILKDAAGGGKFPVAIYIIWFFKGLGMSLVHVNSFPMVVELCSHKSIGRFTGYYYASSMAAQTITPIALGSLMLLPSIDFGYLPVYASTCLIISLVTFMFVANVKTRKTKIAKGLEAFDQED